MALGQSLLGCADAHLSTSFSNNLPMLANGSIVTARAIVRLLLPLRWSSDKVGLINGVPMHYKTKDDDINKEDAAPHEHPEAVEDIEAKEIKRRRLSISMELLREHGYTPGCRRCELHRRGLHASGKLSRHDEACRSRMYRAFRAARGQVGEEENSRTKSSKQADDLKPVDVPVVASETPKDESIEMSPADDLEVSADIGDGDLHMA